MSEYQAGKDLAMLGTELGKLQTLMEQLYEIVEYNVKNKKLEEPPVKK